MLRTDHFSTRARRLVAASTCTLLAALGLTATTAATATAAPDPITDGHLSVVWNAPVLATDANGNGRPDPGDRVTLSAAFTAVDAFTFVMMVTSDALTWAPLATINAGETRTLSRTFVVQQSQLAGAGGSGPNLGNLTVTYTSGLSGHSLALGAPPVLYTAPEPLAVVTTLDVAELSGPVDGVVREGDTVGYHSSFTNTTGKVMTLTSLPGYTDFSGTATLQPGESKTFTHAPVVVTYADMVAGGITFPSATVAWSAKYSLALAQTFTGTTATAAGFVPAEAVNAAFSASIAFTAHSAADGSNLPLGTAQAGDVIDVRFDATNQGNVKQQYVKLTFGPLASGGTSLANPASALVPGASLPNGIWKPKDLRSANGGSFAPYVLTADDVARGYVDIDGTVAVAPSQAVYDADPAASTQTFSERVFLKKFTSNANLAVKSSLNDANGDGIGQAGETIDYLVRLRNNANQDVAITDLQDLPGSHVPGEAAPKFVGKTLVIDAVVAKTWTYTITADDEARGVVSYGAQVAYQGVVNWANDGRSEFAPDVATGAYVAPPTTLDTTGSYVDTNADGSPSIGETVTITVDVTNTGTYPLTGLAVTDAAGSDVTGLLPAFPGTVAPGATATESFTYVLTAADFARGSLGYSTEMTADGLAPTASATSVSLTGITFQAYATDLDGLTEGGIDVCTSAGASTDTVVILDQIWVKPFECSYAGPAEGYRVVAFSSPLTLGVDSFSVKVPIAIKVGVHRLALYRADGTLAGWRTVTVKDPIAFSGPGDAEGALAATGADAQAVSGAAGGAAVLVLLGTAALVASARRKGGAEA